MAQINQRLLERLQSKLGVTRSHVYSIIDQKVRAASLPRNLAAIAVAAERGINISKFATPENLATIRHTNSTAGSTSNFVQSVSPSKVKRVSPKKNNQQSKKQKGRGTTVFVVHGRDLAARDAVFSFLRSLGLKPLEWTQALKLTRKGSPYVGEVLDAAFEAAAAVIVLITPDDEARLKTSFLTKRDVEYERRLTGQARPNVLFEAGMAFGRNSDSTVLVQLGETRPFSDVGGRHVLHLSNNAASRKEFATKLENAGCAVDTSGTDWLKEGNFVPAKGTK